MSRGLPSKKALAAAVPVAQARGQVIFLRQYPGTTCDFLISEPCGLTVVSVKRSLRIRASPGEIFRQFYETLTGIRSAEHPPGIAREFWLWSKYGTMRFFWIDGAVLIEIDRQGVPLNPPVSATIASQKDNRANPAGKKADEPQAGKNSAEPEPGKNKFPEKNPVPGAGAEPPGVSGPAPAPGPSGLREPAAVRYLRKRAKERREAKVPQAGPGPGVPPPG